jgi:hypothetical protein
MHKKVDFTDFNDFMEVGLSNFIIFSAIVHFLLKYATFVLRF